MRNPAPIVLVASGCQTVPIGGSATAIVEIPIKNKTAKVPVRAGGMFPNKHAVAGVKLVQTGQLDEALKELGMAIAEKPKDWETRAALAAVQEAKGLYSEAKQNYIQANLDKGGDVDPNCLAGIARIDYRLKAGQ